MTYRTTDEPDRSALPDGAQIQKTSNYPVLIYASGVRVELHRVKPSPLGYSPSEAVRVEMSLGDKRIVWLPSLSQAQTFVSELNTLVRERSRAALSNSYQRP
ncbi:hypothetical protein [Crossiella sp. CA198]|uniref:hypothetical protein n=1 Tax=Crossiella sp. CA198 TaxID=3455607 RepID=UPI003F8D6A51